MPASSRSRSSRDPQPLTLVEQYVYTNGACHVFLLASDGRAVDAEGKRSLDALAIAFGVPQPYLDYGLVHNANPHAFGKPAKKLVDKLKQRLRDLGWRRGHVPEATDRLSQNKVSYAWASVQAEAWWPDWEASGALPPPDPPSSEHDLSLFVEDAHLQAEDEVAAGIADLKDRWLDQARSP